MELFGPLAWPARLPLTGVTESISSSKSRSRCRLSPVFLRWIWLPTILTVMDNLSAHTGEKDDERCRSLGLFGLYLDLNVLGFLLFALALGQTEAPKKVQHSRILVHYQPIEVLDPSITRIIE